MSDKRESRPRERPATARAGEGKREVVIVEGPLSPAQAAALDRLWDRLFAEPQTPAKAS